MDLDPERGIGMQYVFYLEAIEVHLDCSWTPGSSVSFREVRIGFTVPAFMKKKRCPKAFLWRPCQPKQIQNGIIIEYAKESWEYHDTVVTWDEMWDTVERVEYNCKGEAHIQINCAFSFGTSTTIIKIQAHKYYNYTLLEMSVALEFGTSEECLRFIDEGIDELHMRLVEPNENDDGYAVLNEVFEAVAPVAFDHRHKEIAAIDRGILHADFTDKLTQPATQVTRRRASSPAENHANPCFLMLHLEVRAWDPSHGWPSRIVRVHWSATDSPRAFPSRCNPFRFLSDFHLNFPSPASEDGNDDLCVQSHSGPLTISFSAYGVSVLDGTSSVSARNGLTINGLNRGIVINYISAVMGDGYFAPIQHSNVGGTNSTNHIHL